MIVDRCVRTSYFDDMGFIIPLTFNVKMDVIEVRDIVLFDSVLYVFKDKVFFLHGLSNDNCLRSHHNVLDFASYIAVNKTHTNLVVESKYSYTGSVVDAIFKSLLLDCSPLMINRIKYTLENVDGDIKFVSISESGVKSHIGNYTFINDSTYNPSCSTCIELRSQIDNIIKNMLLHTIFVNADCCDYVEKQQQIATYNNSGVFDVVDMLNQTLSGMMSLAKIYKIDVFFS